MRRALWATAGVAASAALLTPLVATAGHNPNHKKNEANPDLSIEASPTPQVWPSEVAIFGRLRGADNDGKTIELRANPHPFPGPFIALETTTTDAKGRYSLLTRPDEHTNYRVVATDVSPRETSGEVRVHSRMKINRRVSTRTPIDGDEIRFFGTVGPAHEGKRVLIQRRRPSGTWKTMSSAPLSEATRSNHSRYSDRIEMHRDGAWRARIRKDANHRGNKTRRIRINVQ